MLKLVPVVIDDISGKDITKENHIVTLHRAFPYNRTMTSLHDEMAYKNTEEKETRFDLGEDSIRLLGEKYFKEIMRQYNNPESVKKSFGVI